MLPVLDFAQASEDPTQLSLQFSLPLPTKTQPLTPMADSPSPGDRRLYQLCSSSNVAALNPTQQQTLALRTECDNSDPGVWKEAQEEIAPGDVRYRLEPLTRAPLQMQNPRYSSQYFKTQWLPFSTTCGECFQPRKAQPLTNNRKKPSHSGGYNMNTAHQTSFQSPVLGQLILPSHIQGRKVAPVVHLGHVACVSQYLNNFQTPAWSQVPQPGHQQCCLPLLNPLGERVKGKCHSNTSTNFQTETARKPFSQAWGAQPLRHCGLHSRPKEKPLMGSQAPLEDQTTRTTYLPLFSEKVKLCKPKVGDMRFNTSNFSTEHRNPFRPAPECGPQKKNIGRERLLN
ncbi:PREDICTED: uncharacterized protein LOC102018816 isoform X2 [Chinchilla lanigera]|nr:PREDICTED: uncharacterized protein LOC102018816 isoform X2 [Chinchilla lanigera]